MDTTKLGPEFSPRKQLANEIFDHYKGMSNCRTRRSFWKLEEQVLFDGRSLASISKAFDKLKGQQDGM